MKIKTHILTDLLSGISIVVSLHYYFSYYFLYQFFKKYNLELFDVISFQDLSYTLGSANINLGILPVIGFVIFYYFYLLLSFTDFEKFCIKKFIDKNWYLFKIPRIKKIFKQVLLLILGVIILIYIIRIFNICICNINNNNFTYLLIIIILIVFNFLIVFEKNTYLWVVFYIFLMLILFHNVINKAIDAASNIKPKNITNYTISTKDMIFQNSKSERLIYPGYRYYIFQDTITNDITMIPNKDLKIKISNK